MPNPKTNAQLGRIFGLAKTLNASKEDLNEMVGKGLSQLTFDEANALIERLGGEPLPVSAARSPLSSPPYEGGVAAASADGVVLPSGKRSVRSQQKDRQKAGIDQIATAAQLQKMESLWYCNLGRTTAGLEALCRRVNKGLARPRTTKECNRVIEAIKQMNRRRPARKEAA